MLLPPPWPLPTPAVTPLLVLLGLIEATSNEGRSPERLCPNEGAPMAAITTTESVNQNAAWSANPDKSAFILLGDTSISLKAVIKILPCDPRSLLPLGDGAQPTCRSSATPDRRMCAILPGPRNRNGACRLAPDLLPICWDITATTWHEPQGRLRDRLLPREFLDALTASAARDFADSDCR